MSNEIQLLQEEIQQLRDHQQVLMSKVNQIPLTMQETLDQFIVDLTTLLQGKPEKSTLTDLLKQLTDAVKHNSQISQQTSDQIQQLTSAIYRSNDSQMRSPSEP